MDTKLKFLISILIISLITCEDTTCRTYKCGKLDDGICKEKSGADFTLQGCEGDNTFCNINPSEDQSKCEKNKDELSYPGGSCVIDQDCIFQDCLGDKCVGLDLDLACNHQGECVIGSVCRTNSTEIEDKFCLVPLKEGENCTEDEDCENSSGCLNGKCTKYFSQEDDTLVTNRYFCKSGFTIDNICVTTTNVNPIDQPCNSDEECKYIFSNKTEVGLINGSCECGKNSEGKKYCKLGSDHQYYKDWISSTLKLLEDTSLCHTTERENLGICAERTKKDRSFVYRKNRQYAINNQTLAENFPTLAHSDECVKYVEFSKYDDSKVLPDVYQCPKYNCDSKGKSCLASHNPFNEDGSDIKVSLSKVCKDNQLCRGIENIWTEDSVNGTCDEKEPHPEITKVRLPGEDCDDNHLCIDTQDFVSQCVNNQCTGKKEKEICETTTECLAGLYCNEATCVPQVKQGEDCKETYDCENHLACYKGKCIEFGTLKENDDLSFESIGQLKENPRKRLLCEYGQVSFDEEEAFCAVHRYTEETKKNASSDGFVKCDWGQKCSYTDGKMVEERECQCGYNAEGQGYCPLSQDDRNILFNIFRP